MTLLATPVAPDRHVAGFTALPAPAELREEMPLTGTAAAQIAAHGLVPRLIVDASHGNSGKDHARQAEVAALLAEQVATDGPALAGIMLESNLLEGAQALDPEVGPAGLVRGRSVTDACMGWDATEDALRTLATGTRHRRAGTR